MGLYETLAGRYDELFPANPATLDFLSGLEPRPGRAVDLGSATGGHAIALAERGWRVLGIEPSAAMVARARLAALARAPAIDAAGGRVDFLEGMMEDLAGAAPPGGVDLLLCLGNTLPHLRDEAALDAFLGAAGSVLGKGGRLVLQLLNYRRVLAGLAPPFAPLVSGDLVFERSYGPVEDGRVPFRTLLREGSRTMRDETSLLALAPGTLEAALRRAGFAVGLKAQGWSGAAFDEEEDPFLILVAERPA